MAELPKASPLGRLYQRRVSNGQDLFVLVDDRHNRRGTGKTTLSLQLGAAMDRTGEGLIAEKCSINAQDLIRNYTEQPKGSALVLDEGEVSANKYEAASGSNKAIRRLISMGRIEEKYVVVNLPNSGELDRDLKALADVWIMVDTIGQATVHHLRYEPYQEKLLTPKVQRLTWDDVDGDLANVYEELADEKEAELAAVNEDGSGAGAVADGGEDREAKIESLFEKGLTQQEIADVYDISQGRVSQILNGG